MSPTSYPSDVDRSVKLRSYYVSKLRRLNSTAPSLGQCQWRWQILYCRKSYSYLPSSCRIQANPIIYLFLPVPCHIHLVNLILLSRCMLHGRFCILLRKFPFYLLDAPEKSIISLHVRITKIKTTSVIHANQDFNFLHHLKMVSSKS